MSLEHSAWFTLLDVPQPDGGSNAAAGKDMSIWTPCHVLHRVHMLRERLDAGLRGQVPEFDRPIIARASKLCTIGGEGQSHYPFCMCRKDLNACLRLWCRRLPHPDTSVGAPTGKESSIGTPRQ